MRKSRSAVLVKNCGAIVEYFTKEVQKWSGTDWGGGPAGREWIVCPGCQEDINLRSY